MEYMECGPQTDGTIRVGRADLKSSNSSKQAIQQISALSSAVMSPFPCARQWLQLQSPQELLTPSARQDFAFIRPPS
ncbi:hypothetical protein KOW79_007128 [Hemibagrus wyckioides]|uniref:Uncharacterized protein n=1 Tax=Hemibagrus wyckioides TaxID=337641 RepID=A0A9D3SRD5_9TELE|nr:hypothetical protein KOW79_007128 [Hemibagrus wyckioides]